MKRLLPWLMVVLVPAAVLAAERRNLEEEVRSIASGLRCVVCQNLSVADSPSEMAQQMREIVREQLQQGKTPEEINAYFVSKYGEWVLLAPTAKGFSLLLWLLPFVALVVGMVLVVFVVRRWVRQKRGTQSAPADPSLIERVRQDVAQGRSPQVQEGPQAALLKEQARLYADLRELHFDFEAGKLSEADYQYLRRELENQAATALKEIESHSSSRPPAQSSTMRNEHAQENRKPSRPAQASWYGWKIAAGGAFLLIFGVTLGFFLTQSLRTRTSEQDSITGDFLTGTTPGGASGSAGRELSNLLSEGRAAFERREWPKAIEAFKAALEIDANQPEAHTYMGLILAQAGHADGALLAFERALKSNSKFPLALWGKGMVLYQAKNDFSGARQAFERLAEIMPPGAERDQVHATLAELNQLAKREGKKPQATAPQPASGTIAGTISVDPRLSGKIDKQAVLYIMLRSADSAGGPPLAVKMVTTPVFPLAYSVGPENVMMQGMPLAGKVVVSVRLDKDGNAMTREAGDMLGEYQQNPVEVGSSDIDIVIDRMM